MYNIYIYYNNIHIIFFYYIISYFNIILLLFFTFPLFYIAKFVKFCLRYLFFTGSFWRERRPGSNGSTGPNGAKR